MNTSTAKLPRSAGEGDAPGAAGRQLLEAYDQVVLGEGFLRADPHPGNMMWWNDKVYLLDVGMVEEVDAELQRSLLLLLVAIWQEDTGFLVDLILSLPAEPVHSRFDEPAFRAELADLVACYRHLSLKELRLGPASTAHRGLQVEIPGSEDLTGVIGMAERRIALGLTAATAIVTTAITATAARPAKWTTPTFGAAAAVLSGAMLADVLRRR